MCKAYLDLPVVRPAEQNHSSPELVPRTLFTVGPGAATRVQTGNAMQNPSYRHVHRNDTEAWAYLREHFSRDVAAAYRCLRAPSNRGDLYRFAVLYREGGVYLDADMVLLHPFEDVVALRAPFTLGHDIPQGPPSKREPGKQMKILASQAGHPIARCMLDNIVDNVRHRRNFGSRTLELSGPTLLHRCYRAHAAGVAITYMDTRGAEWPYTGMRAGTTILAYEAPSPTRHMAELIAREDDYATLSRQDRSYTDECALEKKK